MMKRGMLLCLTLVVLMVAVSAASAATTGSITVKVTLEQVALTVTGGDFTPGVMIGGTSKATWVSGAPKYTATNTGNVSETFKISASNASPDGWTHATGSSGTNVFVIAHGIGVSPYTSEPSYTAITALTPAEQSFASGVAASGQVKFDLQLTAPASNSTSTGEETITVQLSASAP